MTIIRIVLSSIILAISLSLYSQENATEKEGEANSGDSKTESPSLKRLKPMEKDWGFSFNLTGLISDLKLEGNEDMIGNDILFFRHYLKDNLALRLGLGVRSVSNSTIRKDSLNSAFISFDSTYSRFDFSISGGIEKHVGDFRRLDPYFGAQLMLEFRGKEKYEWDEIRNESPTVSTSITNEKTVEGGTNFGLLGIVGFNYFIAQNVSLGAEYNIGYTYLKTGGNYSEFRTETPSSGSSTSTKKEGSLEYTNSGFQINSTANIVFSIFF